MIMRVQTACLALLFSLLPGIGSAATDHKNQRWTPANGDTIDGVHINVGEFIIPKGSTITVKPGTRLVVTASTVRVEGTLSADSAGVKPNTHTPGTGGKGGDNRGAGGGGYGGSGGDGNVAKGGPAWGVPNTTIEEKHPRQLGSPGGTAHSTAGGPGGGSIKLFARGSFTLNGKISADGGEGRGHDDGSGGGSGGSIWLECATFAGTGTMTARGGKGQLSNGKGGGGGGGRVAIHSVQNTFTGTCDVEGGSGHTPGGKGTFWLATRIADTYPLEGKIGVSRTWHTRRGQRLVASLVSARKNEVVLQTSQKQVKLPVTLLVDSDQSYLLQPLFGLKGDFMDLSLFLGDTEIPNTKNLELDDEFAIGDTRFRAERLRLEDNTLVLKIHSLRTKKAYGPVKPAPDAEIVVGGVRLVFRQK